MVRIILFCVATGNTICNGLRYIANPKVAHPQSRKNNWYAVESTLVHNFFKLVSVLVVGIPPQTGYSITPHSLTKDNDQ